MKGVCQLGAICRSGMSDEEGGIGWRSHTRLLVGEVELDMFESAEETESDR